MASAINKANFTRRISLVSEWHRSLLLYGSLTALAYHSRTSEMQGSVAWIRKDSSYHPEADFGDAHQAASIVRRWSHLLSRKTVKYTTACFSLKVGDLSGGSVSPGVKLIETGLANYRRRATPPSSPTAPFTSRCGAAAKWLLALVQFRNGCQHHSAHHEEICCWAAKSVVNSAFAFQSSNMARLSHWSNSE